MYTCNMHRQSDLNRFHLMALTRAGGNVLLFVYCCCCLTAEAVQRAALTLQSVHDVHGRDRLALGVFRVRDSVADDVLEEDLEHAASFLVDQTRNALDTASTSQTTDGGLSDALDVVAQHLPVTLGATLSQTLASLSTSRHVENLLSYSCYVQMCNNEATAVERPYS